MKTIFKIAKFFSLLLLSFLILEACGGETKSANENRNAVDKVDEGAPIPEPIEEPSPEPIDVVSPPEPVITGPPPSETKPPKPNRVVKTNKAKPTAGSRMYKMPSFPFPPPKASASHTFEEDVFVKASNLYEVSELIEGALKKSGYFEKSYYQIPNGFTLVTRMEKMKSDGSPADEAERWDINAENTGSSFSLMSYFKSLFIPFISLW